LNPVSKVPPEDWNNVVGIIRDCGLVDPEELVKEMNLGALTHLDEDHENSVSQLDKFTASDGASEF